MNLDMLIDNIQNQWVVYKSRLAGEPRHLDWVGIIAEMEGIIECLRTVRFALDNTRDNIKLADFIYYLECDLENEC